MSPLEWLNLYIFLSFSVNNTSNFYRHLSSALFVPPLCEPFGYFELS